MERTGSKRELFGRIARVGHALGGGPGLALLDVLAQGERSVEQLATEAGLSVANASQHLQVLRRAGMVTARREGARVHYRLAGDDVLSLWLSLRAVAEGRVGDVERAARDYLGDEVEAVGRGELAARLAAGDLVVLDVRPRIEFAAATSRAPARSRSQSSRRVSTRSPRTPRWSRTAVVRTASSPTRRCAA